LLPPRFAQVRPGRVHPLNKLDLGACPALDLLFSLQRSVDVFLMLKPHQPVTSVLSGKAWKQGRLMLPCSASNTVGHATIQNARAAADYIHIVMVVTLRRFTPPYRFARAAADPSNPRKLPSTRCRNQVLPCHLHGGRCRFASRRRRVDEPPLRWLAH
jgi:hypothetical protein